MGRFYQTSEPKYVDFIYQPNYDIKMVKVEEEVKVDALERQIKDFSSNFREAVTFEGQKPQMNAKLEGMKNNAYNATNTWLNSKSDEDLRKMKAEYRNLGLEYYQGDVAKSERQYLETVSDYQQARERALKIASKDPVQSSADLQKAQRTYAANIEKGNSGYDAEWNPRSSVNWFNSNKYLGEAIDVDALKTSVTTLGNPNEKYYDGGTMKAIPQGWSSSPDGRNVIDPKTGKEYARATTLLENIGLPFQYGMRTIETEGYQQDYIKAVAYHNLANNIAFYKDKADDYAYLTPEQKVQMEKDLKLSPNQLTEQKYVELQAKDEAMSFSSQYAPITKYEEKMDIIEDKSGLFKYQEDYKRAIRKAEKEEDKPPLEWTTDKITQQLVDLDSLSKYADEYTKAVALGDTQSIAFYESKLGPFFENKEIMNMLGASTPKEAVQKYTQIKTLEGIVAGDQHNDLTEAEAADMKKRIGNDLFNKTYGKRTTVGKLGGDGKYYLNSGKAEDVIEGLTKFKTAFEKQRVALENNNSLTSPTLMATNKPSEKGADSPNTIAGSFIRQATSGSNVNDIKYIDPELTPIVKGRNGNLEYQGTEAVEGGRLSIPTILNTAEQLGVKASNIMDLQESGFVRVSMQSGLGDDSIIYITFNKDLGGIKQGTKVTAISPISNSSFTNNLVSTYGNVPAVKSYVNSINPARRLTMASLRNAEGLLLGGQSSVKVPELSVGNKTATIGFKNGGYTWTIDNYTSPRSFGTMDELYDDFYTAQ